MTLTRDSLLRRVRLCWVVVLVVMTGLSGSVAAVGQEKAVLIGSTSPAFIREAAGQIVDRASPIEGTIDIGPDAEFIFDGGSRWSARVPYVAITQLTYGVEVSGQASGIRVALPWPGSSQFTNKPHYVLTVIHRTQTGADEADVFELGKKLVRPVFEALERRTARRVEFLSVDACMELKSPKDCGLGSPDELRGLKRVHIDTRGNAEHRQAIVAEIEKAMLGVEVVAAVESAEISLRFHGQRFNEAGKNIDGGRGEVTILRNPDPQVVLTFTDRDTSVWGRPPSINFASAFVKAYRNANNR